jgi:hypothetical protein
MRRGNALQSKIHYQRGKKMKTAKTRVCLCLRMGLPAISKGRYFGHMNELVFEVTQEENGGFCAECLSENIFTQGDSWDAVRRNVQEAVRAYYFDQLSSIVRSCRFALAVRGSLQPAVGQTRPR